MTKRKIEICPENVGMLFYNPADTDYYVLTNCETEPSATFKPFRSDDVITLTKPISEFMVFVLMKPTRPIEDLKKPRADKGGKHRRKKQAETPPPENVPRNDLPRYCPEHHEILKRYEGDDGKGVWQCSKTNCTFEIKDS